MSRRKPLSGVPLLLGTIGFGFLAFVFVLFVLNWVNFMVGSPA